MPGNAAEPHTAPATRSFEVGARRTPRDPVVVSAWSHRLLHTLAAGRHMHRRSLSAMVVLAVFAGLYLLGDAAPGTFEATLLFVVPIALAAIEFGLAGGLLAGLLALALVYAWDLSNPNADLAALGYLARAVAYLLLGGLLGRFVTVRRALEAKIARSEQLSLDLMATAGLDGYFKRLNESWTRTLGWSLQELYARPLADFVHPDDRDRWASEIATVAGGQDAVSFRNRYRHRDGSYRWLEWNACVDAEQGVIHANARDITVLQRAEDTIHRHGQDLEALVRDRTRELEQSRRETLQRLALAAEYRDDDTHKHTERVGRTSMLIARRLGLPEETVQMIGDAAPLHDIGKLGISDAILLKPGKLTAAETSTMQEHTRIGATILADSSSCVLRMGAQIALTHHERWDATGYPNGLAGEEIPLPARITAIADTFDAITHKRTYKDARSIDDALAEIRRVSGTHFDPAVVTAFLTLDHALLVQDAHQPTETHHSDQRLAPRRGQPDERCGFQPVTVTPGSSPGRRSGSGTGSPDVIAIGITPAQTSSA
jgi:PAS domain S-box-containing protein